MDNAQKIYKVAKILEKYTAALMIFPDIKGDPESIMASASCGIFESEKERFLVTNDHVVREFYRIRDETPKAIMIMSGYNEHLGSPSIDISKWDVIDRNKNLDIATIRIPSSLSLTIYGRESFKPSLWPPQRAVKDEVVCFCGYSGELRNFTKEEMTNTLVPVVLTISSVNERNIYIVDETHDRIVYIYDNQIKEVDLKTLGGLSGTPIFTQREENFEVIGVLYESSGKGYNSSIICTHFDFIKEDGTIDRGRIPI